jgi:hypothetical protein
MKISNHLPHFKGSNLLVVAGKQEGCFYLVENDDVRQVRKFKVSKPQFTDKESRTERRSEGGQMFGGGSPFKHQDDELERSFIKKLAQTTEDLANTHGAETIYLFCPTYLANQIEKSMSNDMQGKIEFIFYGNYTHQHAFVLLSKIQEYMRVERESGRVEPMSKQALSILNKTNQALS